MFNRHNLVLTSSNGAIIKIKLAYYRELPGNIF